MLVDSAGRRTTLDGAIRRRLYLFRHGSVDYIGADGKVVADTDAVALNATGRAQAAAMRALFADVQIDAAQCAPAADRIGAVRQNLRCVAGSGITKRWEAIERTIRINKKGPRKP